MMFGNVFILPVRHGHEYASRYRQGVVVLDNPVAQEGCGGRHATECDHVGDGLELSPHVGFVVVLEIVLFAGLRHNESDLTLTLSSVKTENVGGGMELECPRQKIQTGSML
jgi:hypothetical protein